MEVVVFGAVIVGLWYLATHRSSRERPEPRWSHAADPAQLPYRATGPVRGARVALALARGEARRWLQALSFAFAIVFAVMGVVLLVLVFRNFEMASIVDSAGYFGILVWPTAGMVIVGMHWAATRSRRDGTDELFATLPASPGVRTAGTAGIAAVGVLIVLATIVAWSSLALATGLAGGLPARFWAESALAVMLVCGAGTLAIFLARVAPWSVAPFVVIMAIAQLNGRIALSITPHTSRQRWIGVWGGLPDVPQRFDARPIGMHALYVAALVLVCAAAAGLAFRLSWRRGALLGGAMTIVAVLALVQLQPISTATAGEIAREIRDPMSHEVCRSRGQLRACAYAPYDGFLDDWLSNAQRVFAAVPRGSRNALGPLLMVQQLSAKKSAQLDPRIVRALRTLPAPSAATRSALLLGFNGLIGGHARFAHAAAVAQWAVGLPVPLPRQAVCSASGQPRGVIALWLTVRAVGGASRLDGSGNAAFAVYGDNADNNPDPSTATDVVPWNEDYAHVESPVVWKGSDFAAARELLKRPDREVEAKLAAHWRELVDEHAAGPEVLRRIFDIDLPAMTPSEVPPC